MLNKLFKLDKNKTNIKTEIIAGITTFLSMGYILAVIPNMLSTTGMDQTSLLIATAIASAVASIIMGFLANYPIVLGPGLGIAALFAFNVVPRLGSWQAAMAAVVISGLIFLLISVTGIRKLIINSIPEQLKLAIGVGIGFFITFIGLKNAGIIIADPSNFVGLGNLKSPTVLLSIFGILITIALIARNVPAAIFVGMIITMVIGLILNQFGIKHMPHLPASFSFDFSLSSAGGFIDGFSTLFKNIPEMLLIVFSFLFVDFFDTAGTLVAVSRRAGLVDENNELPNAEKALMADSISTIIGGMLGVSSVTSFVESTSGVEVGGRTGLTAITSGILFLFAIFLAPFINTMVTPAITTPALVAVGILMCQDLMHIKWHDIKEAAPCFITILGMILTFSISNGIALGFLCYTFLKLVSKEAKDVHYIIWILDIIFIMYFYFIG